MKKKIASLLVLVLALGTVFAFTGCGSKAEETTAAAETTAKETEAEVTEAKETEAAEAAYLVAAQNGQEKNAYKQLSNLFVKKAAAVLKTKNYAEAIEFALKSNEYLENATAMKVAGTAASALQKNEEAIQYLEKYLELSPNAKDAAQMKYTIAATAQVLGDKAKAKEYYQQILSDPKFGPTAKQMLESLN